MGSLITGKANEPKAVGGVEEDDVVAEEESQNLDRSQSRLSVNNYCEKIILKINAMLAKGRGTDRIRLQEAALDENVKKGNNSLNCWRRRHFFQIWNAKNELFAEVDGKVGEFHG